MAKYRKKPVVVEATQWFKNGDHPGDYGAARYGFENGELREFSKEETQEKQWEGGIVRYFRDPNVPGTKKCEHCGKDMHVHGWVETLEGGHIVCPGDWIVEEINQAGNKCFWRVKPDIFEATYEAIVEKAEAWAVCKKCGAREVCPCAYEVESIDACAFENRMDNYNKAKTC